jgi:hypothetical protein
MTRPLSFDDYALHPSVIEALAKRRLTRPTPLQNNVLPLILEGCSIITLAGDGAGRTLAYGAALLSLFDCASQTQACIIVSNKRRAVRVEESLRALSLEPLLRINHLQDATAPVGADVWVTTPAVAAALQPAVLGELRLVVIDDADDIVRAGDLRHLNDFLQMVPQERQIVLFCKAWPAILDGLRTRFFAKAAILKQTESQDSLIPTQAFVLPVMPKPLRAPEGGNRQTMRMQGAKRRPGGHSRFEREEPRAESFDFDLEDLSPQRARGGSEPLAPLPRLVTTWQTCRIRLTPGTRHTRDSAHAYLAQRTGIPRSALRAVQVLPDSISVDVESREIERFKNALCDELIG